MRKYNNQKIDEMLEYASNEKTRNTKEAEKNKYRSEEWTYFHGKAGGVS